MAKELRTIEDYLEVKAPLIIRQQADGKWVTLYAVAKCKDSDCLELSNIIHGSVWGAETICGKQLNENWYITANDATGVITCKDCIAKLEEYADKYPEYGLRGQL